VRRVCQGAQRAGWIVTNFFESVSAAGWTRQNFPTAVKFDVRSQIVREINGVTIGQVMFQGKLIRGGINLAQVVDAAEGLIYRPASPGSDKMRCYAKKSSREDYN